MSALPASLRLPPERGAPPRELEIRPKQVKAWIDALPLAQTVDAARKMAAHLTALNRAKVDVDDRILILETYRPVAATVLDELDAIYSKANLPLGPRSREALALARGLAFELAAGYRIAACEKSGKLLAFGAKKVLPLLVARAMEYLGAELLASYKAYAPAPASTWLELHQLYLFADRQGIATQSIEPGKEPTPTEVYAEALLLSLTDPYRLVPGEADKILAMLRPMRALASLGQARPATRSGGHFVVPCDMDRPPKPALSANDDTGGPNWRLLDTNAIVDKLRQRRAAHDAGQVSQTLSRATTPEALALMSRLAILWGDPPKRAHRREPMETTVAVCVGLKAVGHFVSTDAHHDPTADGQAIRAGITIPLISIPDDETSRQYPVREWDVVNHSAGGVKLKRCADGGQSIVVGDVVGLKFMGRRGWTVGVVRWITQFDEGGFEFGVQFLATTAVAVWVQPQNSQSPQAKPGLLMDDFEGAQQLLTPPALFAELRVYEVDANGELTTVRATGLIEKTARFDIFYVSSC
ncbi:MAG TPA: hypothetical protein VLT89_15930 [Usitatibacter sp.]|nr:hypothetical protein [Usitatibacter sp.]